MSNKRPYPHKKDEERRIVVSFSLSGDILKYFREALATSIGHEPTVEEVRSAAQHLAHQAVDSAIKRAIEFSEVIAL